MKALNGGDLFDASQPGALALALADVRAGKPCAISISEQSAFKIAADIHARIAAVADAPLVGKLIAGAEQALGVSIPAGAVAIGVEFLAELGAVGGAFGGAAAVGMYAHARGQVIALAAVLPQSIVQTSMQLLMQPA